ncbi:MAG: deoxyribose-phosphate aldolase [Candidatus Melainabacteria bacterium HGW-Melainabacteria-1]|nr:MAG: deoxyribose-phosphate aldolase [Candidatus Melainabacteria bacterium HGW-Melainabacteria-1]
MYPVPADIAGMIDHTLLKPEATEDQVSKLCAEAAEYHFASVCINPGYVPLAAKLLKGSGVMVCTVIGFPLGATDSQTKADETRHAVANGADEIDMVINIGALKSRNYQKVGDDIRAVVQAASGKTVKVILETSLLNDEEKVMGCRLSEQAGAHFVKTATGFGPGGATEADIALMRRSVRPDMEVKASGSIRDRETALKMVQAGATRIGASASIAIVKGENAGEGKY